MTVDERATTGSGGEYAVDLYGCDIDLLQSCERLNNIVRRLVHEDGVRPIQSR